MGIPRENEPIKHKFLCHTCKIKKQCGVKPLRGGIIIECPYYKEKEEK